MRRKYLGTKVLDYLGETNEWQWIYYLQCPFPPILVIGSHVELFSRYHRFLLARTLRSSFMVDERTYCVYLVLLGLIQAFGSVSGFFLNPTAPFKSLCLARGLNSAKANL